MKTLTIKDLPRTEALDAKAMAAVQGGYKAGPSYYRLDLWDLSSHDNSMKVDQSIGQSQQVFNANGNNVAFAGDISSTVKPTQTASNSVVRL
ncbi:MAG TPA: hypothetical protein VFF03_11120 [Rhodocyclaceae bacterium]|nr:hypothetical protein [Rhodocyclaceae bacterium]